MPADWKANRGFKREQQRQTPIGIRSSIVKPIKFKKVSRHALNRTGNFQGHSAPEQKYIDTSFTTFAGSTAVAQIFADSSSSSVPLLLNGVAQGLDNVGHIGRKISMKSIHLQAMVHPVYTALAGYSPPEFCRVMLIQDKEALNAGAAVIDILVTDGTANRHSWCSKNLIGRERFHCLMDERFPVSAYAQAAGPLNFVSQGPTTYLIDRFIKCDIPVIYSGTGATVASIETNALYLVVIGDNTAAQIATGIMNVLEGQVRVRFRDD